MLAAGLLQAISGVDLKSYYKGFAQASTGLRTMHALAVLVLTIGATVLAALLN